MDERGRNRITTCSYIIVSNYSAGVGLYIVRGFFLIISDSIFSSHELMSVIKICTLIYYCILAWLCDIFIFHLLQGHGFYCSDYTD